MDVVIKIGVPRSLEKLVQMFGRAGKNGRSAQSALEHNIHVIYSITFIFSYLNLGILLFNKMTCR